ncbi:hypothetical protein ND860_18545 [Leptospira levettii]|uniref:hypothetical protein n=1 Tax=Leptospira levettii TaxID=2023178 RepID=UPI00223D018D|nr:hypothetical protein [Leptospira levettii]MCW7498541.1 hypothetical protein [Leptospira levettii]
MIQKIKYAFSLLFLSIISNCASLENLEINKDCCKKKPSKIYLTFNEKQPNLGDKFEKNYLNFIDYLLKKNNFTIITQFDQKNMKIDDDSVFIDFPFYFKEDSSIIVGGGRNYTSYIKGPQGIIGIQSKTTNNTDPDYYMRIMMTSDYKFDPVSKKYSIQTYESLLLKFANLYSNIIYNLYNKPGTVEGKYIDLINGNIYEIRKENNVFIGDLYGKNSESNKKSEYYTLTFEKTDNIQGPSHFNYFKGNEKRYINGSGYDISLFQFGDMLIIKNPIPSQRNLFNQAVHFSSDTYLLKIE